MEFRGSPLEKMGFKDVLNVGLHLSSKRQLQVLLGAAMSSSALQ
jgi:hypothetical protein